MPNEVAAKPAYRPPIGIPTRDPRSARPTIAAALLHALIVALILAPPLLSAREALNVRNNAAGGPGPAGGGGGGTFGDGGLRDLRERLRFMVLPKDPLTQPPIPIPTPPRVEPKKEETPVKPPEPAVDTAALARADSAASAAGSGGTGRDGSAGTGSGSGGGVGSGTGTGRGSGTGTGTGGGDDTIYPPAVVSLPVLPLPIPGKVRPYHMVAYFDVDTLGNATLISFTPSKDAGYNRRVKEMLLEIRFRPAVRANGVAVRDTAVVTADAL